MNCIKDRKIEVLQSAAGYYIGTFDNGPYCRISECYYKTRRQAQAALDSLSFPFRTFSAEIQFCSGGQCIFLDYAKEA